MDLHVKLILWLFFLLGQLFYIFIQSTWWTRSPAHLHVNSHLDYVKRYWDILLIRGFFGIIVFWLWLSYHDIFNQIAGGLGIQITWLDIKPINPVALGLGILVDAIIDVGARALLDKFGWRLIPSIPKEDAATPIVLEKDKEVNV